MKILEINVVQEAACSKEVGIWNYWDLEHPPFVHKGFLPKHVMYEKPGLAVGLDAVRLPILSVIKFHSLHVMIQQDENTSVAYTTYLGIPSITTYKLSEPRPGFSRYEIQYKFFLSGMKRFLAPLIRRTIAKWNQAVWNEDLPVKLRRQKVLSYGFRDFMGLPEAIKDRVAVENTESVRLPVPRLKGNSVDEHVFH